MASQEKSWHKLMSSHTDFRRSAVLVGPPSLEYLLRRGEALIKEIARKYHAVIPDRDTNAFYDDKLRVTMQAIIYFFYFQLYL